MILEAPGVLSLREVPIPEPAEGELLIRVRAATTCGTDLKAWRRGHPQIPMPGPLGHEYSGEVVAAGAGAKFKPGDAVMGVHSAPCQTCFWCKRDQENLCESIMATKVLGSYAEYLLVPQRIANINVFPKPEALSFQEASLLEPLSCVAQGILELQRVQELHSDCSVLVIGPGAIGLMFIAALKKLGIADITLAGRNQLRLGIGEHLGARTVSVSDIPGGDSKRYDLVIECTGMPEVWERAVQLPRRGGIAMLFGGCPSGTTVTFDTGRIHYDQITILSPFHFGTKAVGMAHDWLSEGLDLSLLITEDRTLEQGPQTFADLEAGRGIKYAFIP